MKRIFDSRSSYLLFCILVASPSSIISSAPTSIISNDQGTTYNSRSTQIDALDRILTSIPTRNPWARWGMEWARWGKNFARMWQLPSSGQAYFDSSYNGGMYPPELPYDRQSFNAPYPGNGPERYPFGRRPTSPSHYNQNQAAAYNQLQPWRTADDAGYEPYDRNRIPRALPSPYNSNDQSNDIRSLLELLPSYGAAESNEKMRQLVTEPELSKTKARSMARS